MCTKIEFQNLYHNAFHSSQLSCVFFFFSFFFSLVQCLEMTTKRKIIGRLVPCRCFRGEEEIISVLDYSHCSLQQVPKEVFNFERTLEELYLDANQIEELPKVIYDNQYITLNEFLIVFHRLEIYNDNVSYCLLFG